MNKFLNVYTYIWRQHTSLHDTRVWMDIINQKIRMKLVDGMNMSGFVCGNLMSVLLEGRSIKQKRKRGRKKHKTWRIELIKTHITNNTFINFNLTFSIRLLSSFGCPFFLLGINLLLLLLILSSLIINTRNWEMPTHPRSSSKCPHSSTKPITFI